METILIKYRCGNCDSEEVSTSEINLAVHNTKGGMLLCPHCAKFEVISHHSRPTVYWVRKMYNEKNPSIAPYIIEIVSKEKT